MEKELMVIRTMSFPIARRVVIESLMDIYEREKKLTPDLVIKEATDKKHPLHPAFEWDDKVAAHKHRLEQARKVIGCVMLKKEVNGKVMEVRAFVNIMRDDADKLTKNYFKKHNTSVFVSVDSAINDSALQKYTLEIAVRDMRDMIKRFENFKELMPLFKTMDKELKKIEMQILKHGIPQEEKAA